MNVAILNKTWCNTLNTYSALWMLMAWCTSTRASATTVLIGHPCISSRLWVNSLAPGKFELNSRYVIFKQILVNDGWGISCAIALKWMSLDFTDDQSTLVQVMAWCRQAASHYLSQCWLRSMLPYGVTRLQWVNVVQWCHIASAFNSLAPGRF